MPDDIAGFGEFPWTVALLHKENFVCSGALLSDAVVLTLASCAYGYEPRDLMVRAGEWDAQTVKEPFPHENRRVIKIIDHADFSPQQLNFNIALLFLSRPFEIKPHISPICLPKSSDTNFENAECLMTGWGQFHNLNANSAILKQNTWQVFTSPIILDSMTFTNRRAMSCLSADLGSPVVCKIPDTSNRYQLIGIMSNCVSGQHEEATVTFIPKFDNWLNEKIGGWFNETLQLDVRSKQN